ncbi:MULTISPECIES: sodium-translocating pyrophosphatase [unclassified Pseudofrankia]|uniref:sodium-translocating pyrophosphatase n=1 Tax=unclassified Pseudofrankia TaxID=2994372 RepID=UPI0009F1E216|nr:MULTISPECIES: sodium-translocating pyrophosphatase [unclassified Pseudofrankia]MDT3441783.1 sodium-translocating pyrophosphatase [Pseudofrankia sp. BMG5.37]
MSPIQAAESPAAAGIDLTGGQLGLVAGVAFIAALALLVAAFLVREVLAASQGGPKMIEVGAAVQQGAAAYLRRQFKTLAGFVVVIPFVLLALPADDTGARVGRSVFFVVGAVFSALVGFVGMSLATRANTRTAAAANERGEKAALRLAFRTGGVVGMFTVGLGLLGAAVVVLVFRDTAPQVLEGFGFGAALLAMFMRVGGGIFTKAADVGADLVGKVEKGIPEDDPRNAATIADNVGDNVGDCAGMAADLFESYAVTLVAALILGVGVFGAHGLVFPLLIPAVGVITAVIGIFAVSPRAKDRNGMAAINRGFFISAVISAIGVVIVAFVYLPTSFADFPGMAGSTQDGNPRVIAISAVLIGIVLAAAIQLLTGYFTETARKPVRSVVEASTTGPATNILAGIGVGLESAVYSAVLIGAAVFGAYLLGSGSITVALFAVALAGTGLLTTVGVIVSMDTFGPVSDNAQGIAEMSGEVTAEGAAILTSLDAIGNTTKAITKGIAIATAVFAATALFGSFTDTIVEALGKAGVSGDAARGLGGLNVAYPDALVGLILGAAVVFLFSGLAINAVGRAAGRVVWEVRAQFRDHPGIMEGTEKPDYKAVVDICTRDSLRELITPGTLAVMAPIAVGFGLGYPPLGSFLAGAIAGGVLMAVFLANSGGAWDNAKKLVEDGAHGGKGSEVHAATVIGDTVGDPFKDTAGPAINPLIKVMNLVSLLIAPTVVKFSVGEDKNTWLRIVIAVAAVAVIAAVIVISKRRGSALDAAPSSSGAPAVADSSNVTVTGTDSTAAVSPDQTTANQVNV